MSVEYTKLKLVKRTGTGYSSYVFFGEVTEITTSKRQFRKPLVTLTIRPVARKFASTWYFLDTGYYVPDSIGMLERKALQGKEIEHYEF